MKRELCPPPDQVGRMPRPQRRPRDQDDSATFGDRPFDSDLDLAVYVRREVDAEFEYLGSTPSKLPLNIPRCICWYVKPYGEAKMARLRVEIEAQAIPGLELPSTATDIDLAKFKDLPKLKYLSLWGTKVTDAGLVHLKGLAGLRWLDLKETRITDAGLANLTGLATIEDLNLMSLAVTDAGLAHLTGLKALKAVNLMQTRITGPGLVHLKGLKTIRSLDFSHTKITDAALVHLAGMTALRDLDLTWTPITDAGLEHLKGLTELRTLWLWGNAGDRGRTDTPERHEGTSIAFLVTLEGFRRGTPALETPDGP